MAFVEPDECISIFSLYISFFFIIIISFLDFMSRIAVFGFLLLNYLMFVTLMPCLYVLLCKPKIRNKDSCILYLRMSAISP